MTGPSQPEPVPGQSPPDPSAPPNVARWVTAGLIVLVCIIGVVSVVGDRLTGSRSGPSVDRPGREPPHIVTYWFTTAGTANEDIEISYTGTDGDEEDLSLPGIVPGWSQEVRTRPGLAGLVFQVSTASSDLNYNLRCVVEIDGYVEEVARGLTACQIVVHFPRPSRERPRVTRTPAASRTAPPSQPSLPTACRLVSSIEVTNIVANTAGGVFKTVLATEGDARSCRYWIDVERGYVEYEWTPGRKDRGGIPANVRVRGLDVTAYWFDYGGRSGRLLMYVRGGELRVQINFGLLQINAKQAALQVAAKARPRLR
jgi:hypothetical protein